MTRQKLVIDSSVGGNGDIWMRLIGLYTAAAMRPDLEIQVYVPNIFQNLANKVLSDRLIILNKTHQEKSGLLIYTSLGLRSLLSGIFKGIRYIAPYQRAVVHDKKSKQLKDRINIAMFNIADFFGIVQIPQWKYIKVYQGFLDIVAIKKLRKLNYESFVKQLINDGAALSFKLNNDIPTSTQLVIPNDLYQNTLVFPTGTSRQFVPVWWAKKYLPNAYFAFFFKDKEAIAFKEEGLKVVYFYNEPGDIIELSKNAKWTVSTDSFPSHLLQYAAQKCTITITEVLRSRIISPAYKGTVIDAEVPCHPCLHLDRTNHPNCAAGYTECLNWKNKIYTQNVIRSTGLVQLV